MDEKQPINGVEAVAAVLTIAGLWGSAFMATLFGSLFHLGEIWENHEATSYWGWIGAVSSVALILATGPVGWWGFGRRQHLFVTVPMLVLPVWAWFWLSWWASAA